MIPWIHIDSFRFAMIDFVIVIDSETVILESNVFFDFARHDLSCPREQSKTQGTAYGQPCLQQRSLKSVCRT